MQWLHQNRIDEDYIIIDDDSSLFDLPDHIKKFLIHTKPMIGLTPDHVNHLTALMDREYI